MTESFHYDRAFERNVGFVTADEQRILSSKKIAIAGMGGVGGFHLLALARLGVGAFNKILLKRGPVKAVPHYHLYDAYENRLVCGKLRWGVRGPWIRIKAALAKKLLNRRKE